MTSLDAPAFPEMETIVKPLQLIERLNSLTHRIDRLRLLLTLISEISGADDVGFASPDLVDMLFWTTETIVMDNNKLVGSTVETHSLVAELIEASQQTMSDQFDVGSTLEIAREFGVSRVLVLRTDGALRGFLLFCGRNPVIPVSEWFDYVLGVFRLVATEHVTASNQVKFVNEVAHDTKGVLAATTLSLDLFVMDLKKLKLARRFSRDIGRLHESSQQAASFLDNGFSMGRYDPETDVIDMILDDVDLFELRRSIVERFRMVAENRRIHLRAIGGRGKAVVYADRSMIARVMTNLVQNAFKFTPAGGTVTIEVEKGDPVVLTVTDTGIGIAPEYHEAVFQRKFQIQQKSARQMKGHGLGLYIVRKIVDQHLGTVRVESEPGAGAKFIVSLPVHGPAGYSEDN